MAALGGSFAAEEDMYLPAAACADALASALGPVEYFFQVKATAGIPDLVLAIFDDEELDRRVTGKLAPIVDAVDVAAMNVLGRYPGQQKLTAEIARRVGMSAGYLSSIVLPRLCEQGHVEKVSRGRWKATHSLRPTVRHLVTVEAKMAAWKQALWQARRHAIGADMAWVLLDDASIKPALRNLAWFDQLSIGVAGLNGSGSLTVHRAAPQRAHQPVERTVLAERVLKLYLDGHQTWQWGSMFGNNSESSTGGKAIG
jgi:hypothetical protein